jgi:hypothetical protein
MTGAVASMMTGKVQVQPSKDVVKFHTIPVDFVSNAAIVVASKKSSRPNESEFYNSTMSTSNPLYFKEFSKYFHEHITTCPPLNNLYWYPTYLSISNFVLYAFAFLVIQLIPALVGDFFLIAMMKKPL